MNSLDKRTIWEYIIMAVKVLWIMFTSLGVIEGIADGDSLMVALSLIFIGIGIGLLIWLKAWFVDNFMESEATSMTMGESIEQYAHEDGKIHGRRVPTVPPNYKLSWASTAIMVFLVVLEATMGMFTSTSYSSTLLNKRVTSSLEYRALKSSAESGEKANEQYLEAMRLYNADKATHRYDCDQKWSDEYRTKRQECYSEFKGKQPTQDGIKVNTAVSLEDVKKIKEDNKNVFLDFSIPILFIFVLSLLEFIENTLAKVRINKFKNNAKKAQEANGTNTFLRSIKEVEFSNITTDAEVVRISREAENKLKLAEAKRDAQATLNRAERIEKGDGISIGESIAGVVKKTLKKSKDDISGLSTASTSFTNMSKNDLHSTLKSKDAFWDLDKELDIMLKEDVNPPKSNLFDSPQASIEKSEDELLADKIKNLVIKNGEMIEVNEGGLQGSFLKVPKNDDLAELIDLSSSSCDRKVKELVTLGLLDIVKVGSGNKTARILIP